MKLLQEALKSVRRLDDEPETYNGEQATDELDFDLDGESTDGESTDDELTDDEFSLDGEAEPASEEPEGEFNLNGDEIEQPEDRSGLDNVATQATDDPNRRGLIRTVKGSHLVYKRESEDGTFEELWVFNVADLKDEMKTRKAILAGTDIPINNTSSPDGKQEYSVWTSGNVEMLKITGLPS